MYMGAEETMDCLFLHCTLTLPLWRRLFNLAEVDWIIQMTRLGLSGNMLCGFLGLMDRKEC